MSPSRLNTSAVLVVLINPGCALFCFCDAKIYNTVEPLITALASRHGTLMQGNRMYYTCRQTDRKQ